MSLPSFQQWLAERGKRTCLGIYPPLYGSGQLPPLAFAPSSASHAVAFATIHGDEHPELLSKEIRDEFKKNKKRQKKGKKGMSLEQVRLLKKKLLDELETK